MPKLALAALLAACAAHAAAAQTLAAMPGPPPPSATADSVRDLVKVGDRILMQVEGERALSDTFTVRTGPEIALPGVGTISLQGVTRQDVEPFLRSAIARYIRNPVVHARTLVLVGIVGEVARPGYYAVAADALLSDALMAAGGMTRDAQVTKLRIDRDTREIYGADATRDALARGLTLGQVGVESGDQLVVPRKPDTERTTRIIGYVLAIPVTIYAIARVL